MPPVPEEILQNPEQSLDALQQRWLEPLGPLASGLHCLMHLAACGCIRLAFRFRVEGRQLLPARPPVIVAPNHESSLDALILAAALPYRTLRRTYWAVRKGRVLSNPVMRMLGRIGRGMPIDRDVTALAAGAAVLRRSCNLVWFPEGSRSRDGSLQEFKFGVGALARHFKVPVVPVAIEGSYEALPPQVRIPRFYSRITVRFAAPLLPDQMEIETDDAAQEIADEVHDRVGRLTDGA